VKNSFLKLSLSWKKWIEDNILRGCTIDSMVDVMSLNGFQRSDALALIAEATNELAIPSSIRQGDLPLSASGLNIDGRHLNVLMTLDSPKIALFEQVLSEQECDELVRLSQHRLKKSTIVNSQDGSTDIIEDRSSSGTYFNVREDEFISSIDERLSVLTSMPVEHGEGLQVIQYLPGGEYKAHFDYFPPNEPGSTTHLKQGGQRVCTVVIYLNDVTAGGQTRFPTLGLDIWPKKGSALLFSYCNAEGDLDARTLHAGMPVIQGEKWIATKWVRAKPYA
jgi:prolyl 4-hydroxylase